MEDSDHEAHSSSDEQDSCPVSPNHSRDHDAEQVPVTPQKTPYLTPLLVAVFDWFDHSEHIVQLEDKIINKNQYVATATHATFTPQLI